MGFSGRRKETEKVGKGSWRRQCLREFLKDEQVLARQEQGERCCSRQRERSQSVKWTACAWNITRFLLSPSRVAGNDTQETGRAMKRETLNKCRVSVLKFIQQRMRGIDFSLQREGAISSGGGETRKDESLNRRKSREVDAVVYVGDNEGLHQRSRR